MNKKVIGKITGSPALLLAAIANATEMKTYLALMVLATIANVATEMKIYIEDRIKGQKVMEIDRNTKNDDIQKLIDLLVNESNRYAVVFEATVPWMYINEILNTFNIPNCCEIKVL
jgi:hypothetical protein